MTDYFETARYIIIGAATAFLTVGYVTSFIARTLHNTDNLKRSNKNNLESLSNVQEIIMPSEESIQRDFNRQFPNLKDYTHPTL